MIIIKSKTTWFILLGLMLFSSMIMNTYRYIGLVLFGISSYAAGAYHIKYKLERDTNEFKKLF